MNLSQALDMVRRDLSLNDVPAGVEDVIELTRQRADTSQCSRELQTAYTMLEASSPKHIRAAR